jgi:hypothetical protein
MESWLGRPFNLLLPIVRTFPFAHHMLQQWGKSVQQWRRHWRTAETYYGYGPCCVPWHGVTGSRLSATRHAAASTNSRPGTNPPDGDRSENQSSQLAKITPAANLAVSLGWQWQWRSTVGILHISSAGPASEVHFITFMYVRHVFFPRKKTQKETATILQLNGCAIPSYIYVSYDL